MLMVYFVLISGNRIKNYTGELPLMVITRLFGLILIAIAVQLIVEGLGDVFPSWLESSGQVSDSPIQDDIQADSTATNDN